MGRQVSPPHLAQEGGRASVLPRCVEQRDRPFRSSSAARRLPPPPVQPSFHRVCTGGVAGSRKSRNELARQDRPATGITLTD